MREFAKYLLLIIKNFGHKAFWALDLVGLISVALGITMQPLAWYVALVSFILLLVTSSYSVWKNEPYSIFFDVDDDQKKVLSLYHKMSVDNEGTVLRYMNKWGSGAISVGDEGVKLIDMFAGDTDKMLATLDSLASSGYLAYDKSPHGTMSYALMKPGYDYIEKMGKEL